MPMVAEFRVVPIVKYCMTILPLGYRMYWNVYGPVPVDG